MKINNLKLLLGFVLFGTFACQSGKVESNVEIGDSASTPTLVSENLKIAYYKDNELSYRFNTPLLERYMLIDSPYMDFTKGIDIETFDSLDNVTTKLSSSWAHYNEVARLWEARGDVVARDSVGKTLYTEQLFWDEEKRLIYSNVETRIVEGDEVTVASSFEADDKMENIRFKRTRGRILVSTAPKNSPGSLASDSTATQNSTTKESR